jgi:broad specificity phosphatase PhoE
VLERLYLVRHGEVENPDGIVYADLEGFHLSPAGRAQAATAGDHLAGDRPQILVSSPLERAVETAEVFADRIGVEMETDIRLLEWRLSGRWAGVPWVDLDEHFPGELEAYLLTPHELSFSPESLDEVADRMTGVVDDLDRRGATAAVLVSHQDPVQALRVGLTRAGRAAFIKSKPGHASITALQRQDGEWMETSYWEPKIESSAFPPPPKS